MLLGATRLHSLCQTVLGPHRYEEFLLIISLRQDPTHAEQERERGKRGGEEGRVEEGRGRGEGEEGDSKVEEGEGAQGEDDKRW